MAAKEIPGLTALDIIKEYAQEDIQDGDVTLVIASEEWDVEKETARARLDKMVREGKLIKLRGIVESGRWGAIYRAVDV